jgi:hypothetical protein
VVEGASLENWSTGNRTGGSNPSLSASTLVTLFATAFGFVEPSVVVIQNLQAGDTHTDTDSSGDSFADCGSISTAARQATVPPAQS